MRHYGLSLGLRPEAAWFQKTESPQARNFIRRAELLRFDGRARSGPANLQVHGSNIDMIIAQLPDAEVLSYGMSGTEMNPNSAAP